MGRPLAAATPASIVNDSVYRKLVLAADASPRSLSLIGAALRRAGYFVMTTESGAECLALSSRVSPRLILLDVDLPEMSGFETCRRMRANPELSRVPITFLTTRKTFDDVSEGLAAGGNDFIAKPFDPAQLLDRVSHWTSRHIGG